MITGTPGTGKTTICRKLSETCNIDIVVNTSEIALEKGFITTYDQLRETYVIDEEKLSEYILELARSTRGVIVVKTHYPEVIPVDIVDIVFVLRTHPLELEKRLESRGWSRRKVNENVMAEILGVISENSINTFGEEKVYEIDTTSKTIDEITKYICSVINGSVKPTTDKIDWLETLRPEEVVKYEDYLGNEDE